MLDVHPPHESIHGWRDFLLHLFTITIGLLIALSLEGCVEWQHHRHLVHEAEASLHTEIKSNADGLKGIAADIQKQQEILKHDVAVLNLFMQRKDAKDQHMSINFHIANFDDVSWKTAQSTGALAYMPYGMAQEYSSLYSLQGEIDVAQQQAVRDAILSLAPFTDPETDKGSPTPEQAASIKDHIQILQGQLLLLSSLVQSLDQEYKKFLSAHP